MSVWQSWSIYLIYVKIVTDPTLRIKAMFNWDRKKGKTTQTASWNFPPHSSSGKYTLGLGEKSKIKNQKCHFLGIKYGHFWQKWLFSDHKKWHFWWQNQNSKTTFIVQTFPKYCRMGFYFMKLSLFSPILAKFQFCWFLGLCWAFFSCKRCKK